MFGQFLTVPLAVSYSRRLCPVSSLKIALRGQFYHSTWQWMVGGWRRPTEGRRTPAAPDLVGHHGAVTSADAPDPSAPPPGPGTPAGDNEDLADPAFTLDALSEATGVPPRTIRFYRQSGLVPPPQRQGRRAIYGTAHLDRLRLIAELRERGLGLEAIARIIEDPGGAQEAFTGLLQIGDELRRPWIDDSAAVLTLLELQERVGYSDPQALGMLEAFTIVTRVPHKPDTFTVPSVALLDLASAIYSSGVTPEVSYRAWGLISARLETLARELVLLFTSPESRDTVDQLTHEELASGFQALRPIAMQAVQLSFAHAIEQALDQFVAEGGLFGLNPFEDT